MERPIPSKEAGDSYSHSVYLATTTDFVTYTDYDDPVLEASHSGGQDGWIGIGPVVKVDSRYYFFYTEHGGGNILEYAEKIMVAVDDTLWYAVPGGPYDVSRNQNGLR